MPFGSGSAPADDDRSWNASWCWSAARLPRPWNTYAYFRRAIDLPDRPTSAVVRVSADARYTLFVNGRRVHHGPARCFPHLQSYDTVDLAEFLAAGPNTVCAIVHQFGVPTGQSVYRDATGFLLDGPVETLGGRVELHTPADWLCRDAAGWRKHVARVSASLGFQEHFDADADPPDWMTPEYVPKPDDGWRPPVVVAKVGGHPWVAMRPRGAPLLACEIEPFVGVLAQFTGENARGYKVAEDVYALPSTEPRRKAKVPLDNVDTFTRDDDLSATLQPPPDGQFHIAVLDLGRVRVAHMIIEIGEAAGDEIIDVLYLNAVDKNFAPPPLPADYDGCGAADRFRCRPGAQRFESFAAKGFRYAAVVFRNVEKPLRIRHVAVRTVQAALPTLGAFECADEQLNKVYAAGLNTLRACSLDALIDAADGPQAQDWADVRAHARAAAAAFGDASLLTRGIRQLAQSQGHDGSLRARPPSDDPRGRDVESMFAWVGSLWDYYFDHGRKELLEECRPTLDRLLAYLAKFEGPGGLLAGIPTRAGDAAGPLASVNLGYLRALRWSAGIYELLKLEAERARAAARADALAAAIESHFWDAKSKSWKDAYHPENKTPADPTSVTVNALTVLLRLRPENQVTVGRDVIQKAMSARRGKIVVPPPTQAAVALDALIEAGLRSEAIDVIRARWGPLVADGATTLGNSWEPAGDCRCAGAAASPVYLLPQLLLGVRAVDVGWRRVAISPLVGTLDFARGVVPTPRGLIRVEWEKAGEDQLVVRVELPEGVEGEFAGPLGETRQLESGASEFHT
jgi:hypothetical protein